MLRLKAERRSLSKVSGASASESLKTTDIVHLSTEPAQRNAADSRHTAPNFPVRASNAAAWALFTLVVGTLLIVGCVLLTLGAPQ